MVTYIITWEHQVHIIITHIATNIAIAGPKVNEGDIHEYFMVCLLVS